MTTQAIELSKLTFSTHNVRRAEKKADPTLKASIAAHGLLNNLVVCAGDKKGTYQVIAGGRRLAALFELQKEGILVQNTVVPCQVVDDTHARELSLAENVVREAMHPADEFEAFAAFTKTETAAEIAKRFGVDEKYVLKRLKLGLVHPKILQAYRDEEIELETLYEYTLTDNQKLQLNVFNASQKQRWGFDVAKAIMGEATKGDDSIVKFVTLEAYQQAGGKCRHDLFGDDIYLEDTELLNKLAKEKLENELEKIRKEGWGNVEFLEDRHEAYQRKYKLEKVPCKSKADKANAIAIVSIDYSGKLDVERGYVDKKAAKAMKGKKVGASAESHAYSQKLREDLAAFRQQAMCASVAQKPDTALDIVLFHAATAVLEDVGYWGGSAIKFEDNYETPFEQEKTEATKMVESLHKSLPQEWTKAKSDTEKFKLLSALPHEQKMGLLALAVGRSITPTLCDKKQDDYIEAALTATGDNVARYWRPTTANFFSRIGKPMMLEIGEKLLGKEWVMRFKNEKSSILAERLGNVFANPEKHAKPEQVAAINAWLPEGMAFKPFQDAKTKKKAA